MQHPASNARQISSQLGLRKEGRGFSPTFPLSLTFLMALWGLQCSIRLDKRTMGTISSEDIHSPELHSETRWIYWAEPLKENLNYIIRNFSPHGCPYQLQARRTKAEPWWGSQLGASIPAFPHTVTMNKHSHSWEEPANVSALKNPHKCRWTWRASGWIHTVEGTLEWKGYSTSSGRAGTGFPTQVPLFCFLPLWYCLSMSCAHGYGRTWIKKLWRYRNFSKLKFQLELHKGPTSNST